MRFIVVILSFLLHLQPATPPSDQQEAHQLRAQAVSTHVERAHRPKYRHDVYYPWGPLSVCETGFNGKARWNLQSGQWGGGVEMLQVAWAKYRDGAPGYPIGRRKPWAVYVWDAPAWQQEVAAERILHHVSWAQGWPACSAKLGLR